MIADPWLPLAIAPRDRRVTLRAERWADHGERHVIEAFPGCKWCEGGSVRHPAPYWRRLPRGWTATGWRDEASAADGQPRRGRTGR